MKLPLLQEAIFAMMLTYIRNGLMAFRETATSRAYTRACLYVLEDKREDKRPEANGYDQSGGEPPSCDHWRFIGLALHAGFADVDCLHWLAPDRRFLLLGVWQLLFF